MTDLKPERSPTVTQPEVVVVGNAGVDTSVFADGAPSFAVEGNFSCNLDSVGQAGGYSSRGFAQLGWRTAFLGHVGDDALGDWVRAELAADGIDLRGLGVDPAGTARSVNVMGAHGARCNFDDGKGHQSVRVVAPPPLDLPLIDTNGAGDALAVGFLTSYVLEGHPLDESVRRGQIAARWTCTQRATSASLITLNSSSPWPHERRTAETSRRADRSPPEQLDPLSAPTPNLRGTALRNHRGGGRRAPSRTGRAGYAANVVAGRDIDVPRLLQPLALSRSAIDAAGDRRGDEAWLEIARVAPSSRYLFGYDGQLPVTDDHSSLRLLAPPELDRAPDEADLFLGVDDDGNAFFGRVATSLRELLPGPTASLREVGALLSARDAGLATQAQALANWHAVHTHCPRCGTPTEIIQAGWVRLCPADRSQHFPRTDPAIIVLVVDDDDRCLLGRQAVWPEGRYSTLAGFVEPGESLERAVIREVFEEVGVRLEDPVYAGNQPWPFPASLMLGFFARAVTTDITVDGTEIEEAGWFSREDLRERMAAGVMLPPSGISIARRLIESWYGEVIPDQDQH